MPKDKWGRIGTRKRAGVLVPLFSVYSKNSLGIGDLEDLKLLIDWCRKTGKSIIQLLPTNEVGPLFCPYDSVSSFALELIYLSLRKLSSYKNKNIQEAASKLKDKYPVGLAYVDYRMKEEKLSLLWQMYCEEFQNPNQDFEDFKEENSYWLDDFALFKVIKFYQYSKAWWEWEEQYKTRQELIMDNFRKEHEKEIIFQIWLQWQLYKQFREIKDYAASRNILIKGDLPILVSRDSADVWAHPDFFKLEFAAGAPPDMYCAKGQRWGMPTYNWVKIAADGYRYLKEKLKYAQNFYDILRIDHVVGLFRIWSIPYNEPLENEGLNGFFDPGDESSWGAHGRNLLEVINNNTDMLLCAEDLGIIPRVCIDTLRDLGIPGNDVQRWVKDWNVRHDFLGPQEYRGLSVAMLSTHDTTSWAAWWENEAGTIDEELFIRKCHERLIDYNAIKDKLFDSLRSRHRRLRWKDEVNSSDALAYILGRKKEELMDFVDIYENTFSEKEKLWKHLSLKGKMREKCDKEIIRAALKITLNSQAIFCIELITDLLSLTDIFKRDSYKYRVNTPGTISPLNWSLTIPLSLDELLRSRVNNDIKSLVSFSGRA